MNFKLFDSIALTNRDSIKFYCNKLSLKSINIDLNYKFIIKKNMGNLFKVNSEKYHKFSKFQLNYKTNPSPYLNQWETLHKFFKQKKC